MAVLVTATPSVLVLGVAVVREEDGVADVTYL